MSNDRQGILGSEIFGNGVSRRNFLRGLGGVAAFAAGGSILEACGTTTASGTTTTTALASKPRRGGTLRVGATGGGSADSLDAQNGYTTIDGARIGQLYRALVSYNAKGELVYELAESITPDATATNWTVRLRPGITFHDGKPLTADDVIFSIQRIMNPKSPLPGAASLGPIDLANLKKVDNLTVKIPYTQPYATLLDQMSYYYFQYIVPVGYDPTKPNGTGPYKYKSFTPGQQSTFVRNPNYWKAGLPYLDEVIITDFADEASMLNALQAGELDAIGGIGAQSYNSLKSNTGVSTLSSKSGAFQPFTMRVDQKPFSDVRVRQAFRLAVNRVFGFNGGK
ncbi:ABC transporter substrate-binding protein [Acidithrix ferrooxidans]|uniref:Glutathione-binding protein GsiB n=1 Tax=Acidithrix ferrooxidans TaxID=1280514 RepID=A0A0D8HC56_9ACTN|nr:ABC transporter substrate-binding protein [Acidithrix ferrooxidans]KJF15555.1 glutathione-binding protein GsiB precursor [Acidithrix ferrooxidans]